MLGSLTYQMIFGKPPYEGNTIEAMLKNMRAGKLSSEWLNENNEWNILRRMLDYESQKRPNFSEIYSDEIFKVKLNKNLEMANLHKVDLQKN